MPAGWQEAPWNEVKALEDQELKLRKTQDAKSLRKLKALGFEGEHSGEALL
jgi:U6 snRNA-associated Sm-like protein LSm1